MVVGTKVGNRLHLTLELKEGDFVNDVTLFEVFAHVLVIILSCSFVCFIQDSGDMIGLRRVYNPLDASYVANKSCKKHLALKKLLTHMLDKRQLNIPFDHLLFAVAEDRSLLMHPLWTKISLDVSATYPPASPSAEEPLQYAFLEPLHAFFLNDEVPNRSEVCLGHVTTNVLPTVTMVTQTIWDQNQINKVHHTCDCCLHSKVLFAESFWCFVSSPVEAS